MSKLSDQWETPRDLFNKLDEEFNFNVDLCATGDNTKCEFWCQDALNSTNWPPPPWICFMNPPYSNPYPFVKMAYEMSQNRQDEYGQKTIVCLLKCDPSTKTWGVFWDYEKQQPKKGIEIRFIPKRLKYEMGGVPGTTAPFPSVIVIMRHEQSSK